MLVLDQRRQGKGKLEDIVWESQSHVVVALGPTQTAQCTKLDLKAKMARNVSSIAIVCAPASPCLTSRAIETTEPEASETNEGLPVLGVLLGIETERRRHVSWAHVTRCACRPQQGGGRRLVGERRGECARHPSCTFSPILLYSLNC